MVTLYSDIGRDTLTQVSHDFPMAEEIEALAIASVRLRQRRNNHQRKASDSFEKAVDATLDLGNSRGPWDFLEKTIRTFSDYGSASYNGESALDLQTAINEIEEAIDQRI